MPAIWDDVIWTPPDGEGSPLCSHCLALIGGRLGSIVQLENGFSAMLCEDCDKLAEREFKEDE